MKGSVSGQFVRHAGVARSRRLGGASGVGLSERQCGGQGELLSLALEQSPVATLVVSAKDRVLRSANRAAQELLGTLDGPSPLNLPIAEVFRRRFWEVLGSDGAPLPPVERPLFRVLGGQTLHGVKCRVRQRGGRTVEVRVDAAPVRNAQGKVEGGVVMFSDTTRESQACELPSALLDEHRAAIELIDVGIVLVSNRAVRWANPAACSMFGCERGGLDGAFVGRAFPSREGYIRASDDAEREIARAGVYSAELPMRRRSGSEFSCHLLGRAVDQERPECGTIWILRDLTECREAEERHLASQSRLEAAQRQARIGSWEVGPDHRILHWSVEMYRLLSLDPRDGLPSRRQLLDLIHPDDRERVLELERLLGATPESVRCEFRSHPGSSPPKHFVLSAWRDAAELGGSTVFGTLQDVTERAQAEERFLRLVENSNDIAGTLDRDGVVTLVTGPLQRILGYRAAELIGRSVLSLVHPDDVSYLEAVLASRAAGVSPVVRSEFRLRHKDGRYVPVESVGRNCLDEPSIRGVVLNLRDISERKEAERRRDELQDQLEQVSKMEAIGRLAGGIAHDFNNLLGVILGNVELAQEELRGAVPAAGYLEGAADAAERAAALTRQLLAFSRRQIIQPRAVNLNELVSNLEKMLSRLIGENIVLRTVLGPSLGAVRADPGQFEQVVVNLVVNARDAMPGGGRLTIETRNVELDEFYCQRHAEVQAGEYVMLSVADTGEGITAPVRERMFEPFFTTKPEGRGTGLGLPMIVGAVQQSSGSLEVYSEAGHGTTFKIYLPRVSEPAECLSERPPSREPPGGHETILVVEDDDRLRELATVVLRRLGYVVLAAPSAAAALAVVEEYPEHIDVLMTDVVMPGMNGRELVERTKLVRPTTAVLYTSGYTEDVIVSHGILRDNLAFIAKPYTVGGLATRIRKVLRKASLARGSVPSGGVAADDTG